MNGDNKRRIDNARDALVGILPDPKGQVEQITTALMYKFLSEQDAESIQAGGKASYFIGKYRKFSWENILSPKITGDERAKLYAEALESMGANPKLPDVFQQALKGAYSPFRGAHSRALNLFLHEINQLNCSHTEDLGDAYEHLLSIMGTQGDAGQFRTPRHIIDFIVEVVNPQIGEKVLDPACGSAGFLVSAHKHIVKTNTNKKPGDKLTQAQKRNLSGQIEGRDIDPGMARLALVNLFLHNVKAPRIEEFDTLSDDSNWNKKYDVILANPPFMTPKGGIQPHDKFTVRATRAEVLFVDYIAEHLTPQGRAGIIVPEGIVFQSGRAYQELRKYLVDNWGLYAVVSLPTGVFNPYSGVKTSILFLDKARRENASVLFVKIENDGFDLGAQQKIVEKNDLPLAFAILKEWEESQIVAPDNEHIVRVVEKTTLAKDGDYNLTSARYREAVDYSKAKWTMVELGEVAEYINGFAFKPSDWKKEGMRIIRIQNLTKTGKEYNFTDKTDISEKYLVKNGDLLISWSATIGFFVWNDGDAYLNQHIFKVVPSKKILINYLYYLKESVTQKIIGDVHGNTMQHITRKKFDKIKIPLPPLAEQERIVAEISSYEKVRDNAHLVVENWQPAVNINSDCPIVNLGSVIVEMKDGGTPSRKHKEYFGGDINWAVVKDIRPEIHKTKETLSKTGLKNSSAKVWPVDSVIISLGATIGNVGIAKIPLATKQGLSGIIVDKSKITPKFLYYILCSKKDLIDSMATGSSIREIRPSRLQSNLQIPLPPLAEQELIVADIESEQRAVDACRELCAKMDSKITTKIAEVWREKS